MENIPKKQIAFYVFHPEKKLTDQQKKVKNIAKISKVCLKNEESESTKDLYKCVQREAKINFVAL